MNQLNTHYLTDINLQRLLATAAELGARRALIGAGLENPMLTWSQACKRFGQGSMLMWRKQHKLNPIQQGMGATAKYYVQDLLTLSLTVERHQYLTMAERREKSPDEVTASRGKKRTP